MKTTTGGASTTTLTTQFAVCGTPSLFAHWMVTLYVFAGVAALTSSVAFAVPPTPPAGVKPVSVIVPGSDGVMPVMVALMTVPSASLALMPCVVAVPAVVVTGLGQLGTIGLLTTAPCGVMEKSSTARP